VLKTVEKQVWEEKHCGCVFEGVEQTKVKHTNSGNTLKHLVIVNLNINNKNQD
jgi:predicted adenine nucleotide alpha hydrolase (AANH) superfamily ATPase